MCMKTELEQLKEQLNQISEKIKELETPSFQRGKWYKGTGIYSKHFFCCTKLEKGNVYGTGYGAVGNWLEYANFAYDTATHYVLATDKEVEEALIKEAKKRGFKEGVKLKHPESVYKSGLRFNYLSYYADMLCDGYGHVVFKDGIWAEIIKDEPLKVCGYELVTNHKGSETEYYSIGCKNISRKYLESIKYVMDSNSFKTVQFDNYKVSLETINKILEL
jgi:hypothetical protein